MTENFDYTLELDFAKSLARQAGRMLLDSYNAPTGVLTKSDGTLVSDVDKRVARFIVAELAKKFPQYAILDEENPLRHPEKQTEGLWIIDPLDGTRQYLAKGRDFGVLIGLVKDGKPILGVAYRPVIDELAYAEHDRGAFMQTNGKITKLEVTNSKNLSVLVSDSREDSELTKLLDSLQPEKVHKMHGAFKAVEVAKGTTTAYMCSRINTMHVWDICAPSIIVTEAGGKVTDLHGKPINYSLKETTKCKNGIIVSNGFMHERIIATIAPIIG